MKMTAKPAIVVGLLIAAASPAAAQVTYTYTMIDFPGASVTNANGINAAGQIVGRYSVGGVGHGFLRDAGGNYSTIDFPGATFTLALGINSGGQIAGYYNSAGLHGFLRDAAGNFTPINVPGALVTSATGVNATGQVVGTYTDSSSVNHGFVRSPSGSFTTVSVPGAMHTEIYGVNDAGQLVGRYEDAALNFHGFLLAGSTYTFIDVPGATTTSANGANNFARVVGGADFGGGWYLWNSGTFSFSAPPWTSVSTYATGINDPGQVVGVYTSPGGIDHGFLATPVPEPGSLTLCACGAALLLRCRRGSATHREKRKLVWGMSVLSLLISVKPSSAQLIVSSTSGPLTATIDFRGTVSYDLSSVGGAGNSGTFSGYNLAVAQTASSTGTINFSYAPAGPYDFTTATGFGSGGFRTTFRYTNNTGASVTGLRFDLTQGQSAFFTNLNGIPSRGTLNSPAGPNPDFLGLTSNQVPNGDNLIHNGNSFMVDTIYDWSFATPLINGGTYAFFFPIEAPVTSPGGLPPGAFTLAITPIPEPTGLVLAGTAAACGWAQRRRLRLRLSEAAAVGEPFTDDFGVLGLRHFRLPRTE